MAGRRPALAGWLSKKTDTEKASCTRKGRRLGADPKEDSPEERERKLEEDALLFATAFQGDAGSSLDSSSPSPPMTTAKRLLDGWLRPNPDKDVKEIVAKQIVEGTLLDDLADEHLSEFMPDTSVHPVPEEMTFGTLCSGSDVCRDVLGSLSGAFRRRGVNMTFRQTFSCEKIDEKRKFCIAMGGRDVCAFKNMKDMCSSEIWCDTHHRRCRVERPQGVIVGFSCKDMSKATAQTKKLDRTTYKFQSQKNKASTAKNCSVLSLKTSVGGSAETFHWLMDFTDSYHPDWLLCENTDGMADGISDDDAETAKDEQNLNIFRAELGSRHYEVQPIMLNTVHYGLPARRRRLYFLCVSGRSVIISVVHLNDDLRKFLSLLEKCKRRPPSLLDVMADEDDVFVKQELRSRMAHPTRGWEGNSFGEHQQVYAKCKLRWGSSNLDARTKTHLAS